MADGGAVPDLARLRSAAEEAAHLGGCQECGLRGPDLLALLDAAAVRPQPEPDEDLYGVERGTVDAWVAGIDAGRWNPTPATKRALAMFLRGVLLNSPAAPVASREDPEPEFALTWEEQQAAQAGRYYPPPAGEGEAAPPDPGSIARAISAVRHGAVWEGFNGPTGVTKDEALEYAQVLADAVERLLAERPREGEAAVYRDGRIERWRIHGEREMGEGSLHVVLRAPEAPSQATEATDGD